MQLGGITSVKTCATEASAVKTTEAKFGQTDLRYLVMKNDGGRFYPRVYPQWVRASRCDGAGAHGKELRGGPG
jgi:hypothetical protein